MHPSPEVLALLALGETNEATTLERAHIETCTECFREVEDLSHLAAVGRSVEGAELLVPADRVWDRVLTEVRLLDDSAVDGARHPLEALSTKIAVTPTRRTDSLVADESDQVVIPPTQPSPSRRVSRRLMALAAAVALVVGLGVGLGIGWNRQPGVTVLARADLAALPTWNGSSGSATLQRNAAGQRIMTLDLESSKPLTGSEAVWLVDPDDPTRPLYVGLLDGSAGIWSVPSTIDVARYRLVDVSEEPAGDTDPTHSGNSIVRGALTT